MKKNFMPLKKSVTGQQKLPIRHYMSGRESAAANAWWGWSFKIYIYTFLKQVLFHGQIWPL